METYDIVMLVVLVGAAIFGAVKGFAWQLASIASIVVSYIVAYRFREPLSQSIQAEPPWNLFLAMLILFIGTSLVIWVGFRMVSKTIDRLRLKEFDRQIGFLFGLAKGGLYCTLITLFAVTLLGESIRQQVVASKSGMFISRTLDQSESVIPPEIHQVIRPYLDRLDEGLKADPQSLPVLPDLGAGSVSPVAAPGAQFGPGGEFGTLPNASPQQLQAWANSAANAAAGAIQNGGFQNPAAAANSGLISGQNPGPISAPNPGNFSAPNSPQPMPIQPLNF